MKLSKNLEISQVHISPTLEQYFGNSFREYWELDKYEDPTKHTALVGLYTFQDIKVLREHKGSCVVFFGGGDMTLPVLKEVRELQKIKKIYTWGYPGEFSKTLADVGISHKSLYIPLKSYDMFQPSTLGERVYLYKGVQGNRGSYFKWEEVALPLIEEFGKDRITYASHLPLPQLVETVYRECFAYVKPTPKGGCTTMWELGHMGIRTIGQGHEDLPNFKQYSDIKNLVDLLKKESTRIGTVQTEVSEAVKGLFVGREWLSLDYWENR